MKSFINKNKGITLIALIITILVMLILAVVSISAVVGDNGVMTRAEKSQDEQKCATITDHRDLWWSNLKVANFGENTSVQTLDELVEDLKVNGVITEEDKQEILETGELKFDSIDKSVVFYEVRNRQGEYVQYDGKLWIILYDDVYTEGAFGLQMVAEEPFGKEINLGNMDETVPAEIEGKINKAIYSYNHSIERLNKECDKLVKDSGIILDVRSIGTNPILNKKNESGTENFYSNYLDEWEKSEYNNKIRISYVKTSDGNALTDIKYGANEKDFWYAFNRTDVGTTAFHGKNYTVVSGSLGHSKWNVGTHIFEIGENTESAFNISRKILPVIILSQGVLENNKGEGTKENPYILD